MFNLLKASENDQKPYGYNTIILKCYKTNIYIYTTRLNYSLNRNAINITNNDSIKHLIRIFEILYFLPNSNIFLTFNNTVHKYSIFNMVLFSIYVNVRT